MQLADTARKLNVHKTFRRRPGRLLSVLCTFNLPPVSTGKKRFLIWTPRKWEIPMKVLRILQIIFDSFLRYMELWDNRETVFP